MLCKNCWHDNPDKNRYCGMCGSRLEASLTPAEQAPPPPATRPAVVTSRSSSSILGLDGGTASSPTDQSRPGVAGPSFLGLNDEPDPRYLLEDDEEGLGGHVGLLVVSVLLMVAAFAAYHFRAQLSARAVPVLAAVLERVHPQPPSPATPPPAPAVSAPAASTEPLPTANDAPPAASVSPPSDAEERPGPATDLKSTQPAQPTSETAEETTSQEKSREPAKYARASRPKPRVAEAVSPRNDPTLKLAQKYIHGQGVRRDCTTGLAYLREAMKRHNPEAASQMGALYATGTCVPLNRVTAYHWFSSALQMAPSNPWLARERDELYAQMSTAERRQADRQ